MQFEGDLEKTDRGAIIHNSVRQAHSKQVQYSNVSVRMCLPEFQVTELLVIRKEADVLFT